ncbi:MAG TPA: alpha/beta hydrolase [Dokdonella sp.]|uniref:alpha/beta fold hydrolase n=1 Tax=Dokdonella sp. TaxID=2291710 RepID=UPI002CCB7534|nr:alpha/beta hydrolase [Dokdonella sp.]HUD43573.1 alpha/beta hydrolase [Dokdonella sp.]
MDSPDLPEPAACAFIARDGVRLAAERYGAPDAPPVLFAHGFGQTGLAWRASAARLAAAGRHCIAFDARGHGRSGRPADGEYHLEAFADDLLTVARGCATAPVLVGASMGGLLGLLVEGEQAPLFSALVLVDITPRWEPAGVARILAFMQAHPDGFADLDAAAAAIAAYLPQRGERRSPERLRDLLIAGADGRLRWHWDPRMLGPVAGEGERYQPRLFAAARRIRVPTLLVSGGASDVVSAETIGEFLALVPHARHVSVADATHMVVGDRNDRFTRHVEEFLNTLPSRPPPEPIRPDGAPSSRPVRG